MFVLNLTDLLEQVGRVFTQIVQTSGKNIYYNIQQKSYPVNYTTIRLNVEGIVYDRRQGLLGIIVLDDCKNQTGNDDYSVLRQIAYCAERSRAVSYSQNSIPFDWHVFLLTNRQNVGDIIAEAMSIPRSAPYGISVLYGPDEDTIKKLGDGIQRYLEFLNEPGRELPSGEGFFEIVRFFAPLLPFSRIYLQELGHDPTPSFQSALIASWKKQITSLAEKHLEQLPADKRQSILQHVTGTLSTVRPATTSEKLTFISSVDAKHFRAIRTESPLRLSKHTFITGGNGTGKSSFIETLELGLTGSIKRLEGPRGTQYELAVRNIDGGFAQNINATIEYSTSSVKAQPKSLTFDGTGPFAESFRTFSLNQYDATESLHMDSKDRCAQVLGMMGIDTESLDQLLQDAQRRAIASLQSVWGEMVKSGLNIRTPNVHQQLHESLRRIFEQTPETGPSILDSLAESCKTLSECALDLIDRAHNHQTLRQADIQEFSRLYHNFSGERRKADIKYTLANPEVDSQFRKALSLLQRWKEHLASEKEVAKDSTMSPEDVAKKDTRDALLESPENLKKSLDLVKQLQAYRSELDYMQKTVTRFVQETQTILAIAEDDPNLLSAFDADLTPWLEQISTIAPASEEMINRIAEANTGLADVDLEKIEQELQEKLKKSATPLEPSDPISLEKVIEGVSPAFSIRESILEREETLPSFLLSIEQVELLQESLEKTHHEWKKASGYWHRLQQILDHQDSADRVLSSHLEGKTQGLFDNALTADLLSKGRDVLKAEEENTLKTIMARSWYAGWMEFSSLLSASRWGHPVSRLRYEKTRNQGTLRITIPAQTGRPQDDLNFDLVANQGELCLSSLAWLLLGYSLCGQHKSNVLIVDDPFFALDPAHQRYAIESLVRIMRVINQDCQLIISVAQQDEVTEFLSRFDKSETISKALLRHSEESFLADPNEVTILNCSRHSKNTCNITATCKKVPHTLSWRAFLATQESPQSVAHAVSLS